MPLQPSAENLVLILSSLRLFAFALGVNISGDVGKLNLSVLRSLSADCSVLIRYPILGYNASASVMARSTFSTPVRSPERAVDASFRNTVMSKVEGTEP